MDASSLPHRDARSRIAHAQRGRRAGAGASAAVALLALCTGLAACASSKQSSAGSSVMSVSQAATTAGAASAASGPGAATPSSASAEKKPKSAGRAPSTIAVAPAATGPGAGKPAVTIGEKNSIEENVLGALYAEALASKGFKVTLNENAGPSGAVYKELTSGQVDAYPEYTGTLLSAIANLTATPASPRATYERAKVFVNKQGLTLLGYTPFSDSDALATRPRYAGEHGLSSIASLQTMGRSVTLGAAPEFATRSQGLLALERDYGVYPTFRPITTALSYRALESGQVDVQDVSSTDPQLLSGKFELLADPKNAFGFQNVAPVVRRSVLAAEGPAFAQTMNRVSSLLTTSAIQRLNAEVAIENKSANSVARHFLSARGLS
jgi:osmoprotectant transport system substrate-binding protein